MRPARLPLKIALLAALAFAPAWCSAQGSAGPDGPPTDTVTTPEETAPEPAPPTAPEADPADAPPSDASSDEVPAAAAGTAPRDVAVDSSGGPLTLPEDVTAAADVWRQAVPDLVALRVVGPAAGSGDRIVFADPSLMGPDTLSLGLRFQGGEGIEIWLDPQGYLSHPSVLLHELGVLLGLPEGGEGVMAFTVPGEGELDAPSPADVSALRDLRRYRAEDLTRDGVVDFGDLVALGQAFGSQGVNLPADLDGDGNVGPADLDVLRGAYDFTAPEAPQPAAPAAPETAPGEVAPSDIPADPTAPDETPPAEAPPTETPPTETPPGDTPPTGAPPPVPPADDGGGG